MKVRPIFASAAVALLPYSLLSSQTANTTPEVTYTKDVAPILYQHCVVCHHPNDIAPMSLMNYKEVRPWAKAIREKVVQRIMPPWHADAKFGEYRNDPRLSDFEIETIRAWVESGTKEGEAKDLPPAPAFREGWHIEPDAVFTTPEQVVAASNQDDMHYFYVPTNFTEDKWVQIAEVLPGDRRIVHHASVEVVSPSYALNHKDDRFVLAPEDAQFFVKSGTFLLIRPDLPVVDDGCASPTGGEVEPKRLSWGKPQSQLAIYLPGHGPEARPKDYAVLVPKGAYLEFDVHYSNRLREDTKDHTSIGLVFAKAPVLHGVSEYEMWNELFQIPAFADNHRVTRCTTVPRDIIALSYTAHMHYRGKSMRAEAVYPDGHHEVLMNVPRYDFRWQETYFLKEPKLLPKGTQINMTAYFDNSRNNPLNPDPSATIRWGEPSNREMVGFWVQYADADPSRAGSKITAKQAGPNAPISNGAH